jgi:DNA-binding NtrC family response regulator
MKPLLVLIWDGDAERRQVIATILREAGHQVALANNAADLDGAVGKYDLVVLDPLSAGESVSLRPPESLDEAERRHLALTLRHTAGNKRKAAHLLGISRSTLLNKVRKYGLDG